MNRIKVNSFTSYNLTPEEELHGHSLGQLQIMVLQNRLAEIAQEKINLVFDPLNPVSFAQQEAGLAGQMGIIQWLLDTSEASVLALAEIAKNPQS